MEYEVSWGNCCRGRVSVITEQRQHIGTRPMQQNKLEQNPSETENAMLGSSVGEWNHLRVVE